MEVRQIHLKDIQALKSHIASRLPTLYVGSSTSTVIPYDHLSEYNEKAPWIIGQLGQMPSTMSLEGTSVRVRGAVNWNQLRTFLAQNGRMLMTSPTEELALVLSGAATSATGERCFGLGTLREQILELEMINYEGKEYVLKQYVNLMDSELIKGKIPAELLRGYNQDYLAFKNFKNAPFPRMQNETDLFIGTEGQLGIITGLLLKTIPKDAYRFLFIRLPNWVNDFSPHLEIFNTVSKLRNKIISCELLDAESLSVLPNEMWPHSKSDLIFMEVKEDVFEELYEEVFSNLKLTSADNIYEMEEGKARNIRMSVPRATFEANARANVVKMGTDAQVKSEDFEKLLKFYQEWTKLGLKYNLFGHFGDAHLHFNFLPKLEELDRCQSFLNSLYPFILNLQGSPFAEHGIGLLKRKFIGPFFGHNQFRLFKELKKLFDPYNQFFPQGYMNLSEGSERMC